MKSVAGVFSYSKTKGLFAGVSLEGSAIIERRDANEKLYNTRITARQILEGGVRPPPAAEPLMRVLNSRVFAGLAGNAAANDSSMYNDIPIYSDTHDNVVWEGRTGTGYNEGVRTNRTGSVSGTPTGEHEYRDRPSRASTWQDDVYDRQPNAGALTAPPNRSFSTRANPTETFDSLGSRGRTESYSNDDYSYSDNPAQSSMTSKPGRPTAPKPKFTARPSAQNLSKDQAVALYTFDADQPGDLGFKKGDVMTIVKRTDNASDWWTGRIGDKEGTFPRYVFLPSNPLPMRSFGNKD